MKTCNECGESKPLGEFYRHKHTSDGRQTTCKECHKKLQRERYEPANSSTRPESIPEANARWALTEAEQAVVREAAEAMGVFQAWQTERHGKFARKPTKPVAIIDAAVTSFTDRVRLMHATVDYASLLGAIKANAYNHRRAA